MTPPLQANFIQFLQQEMALSPSSVSLALRHLDGQSPHLLPIVLWQYGFVTLEQLGHIFDWLESADQMSL
jgi:hypothetical protein